MVKNEICEIRNLPFFRELVEILKKFQNWHIGDEKLTAVYFQAFFSKITFSCCLWKKTKFAIFAICKFYANHLRYSKNSKTGIFGMKH